MPFVLSFFLCSPEAFSWPSCVVKLLVSFHFLLPPLFPLPVLTLSVYVCVCVCASACAYIDLLPRDLRPPVLKHRKLVCLPRNVKKATQRCAQLLRFRPAFISDGLAFFLETTKKKTEGFGLHVGKMMDHLCVVC